MFRSEHELREAGEWREDEQVVTETICPYCGVGCSLELHVQDNRIVKVTSPDDHDVTRGNLCIKGRFGFQHVHVDGEPNDGPPAVRLQPDTGYVPTSPLATSVSPSGGQDPEAAVGRDPGSLPATPPTVTVLPRSASRRSSSGRSGARPPSSHAS